MADLIEELNKAVRQGNPTQGKVLSVSGRLVTVATPNGVKQVSNPLSSKIIVGDTLQLNGGTVVGVFQAEDRLPVYHV